MTSDQPGRSTSLPLCEACRHPHHPHPVQCNHFVLRDGAYQQCQCGAMRAKDQPTQTPAEATDG